MDREITCREIKGGCTKRGKDCEGCQVVASMQNDNFDLFIDRVKSLVDRWEKFHTERTGKKFIGQYCIKGFLSEVNDDFTQFMMNNK